MRIRTLAAAAVLATAATLPLSGIAFAEDQHDCELLRVELDKVVDAQLNRLGCRPDQNHPVNRPRPDDGRDKPNPDCVSRIRDHIRDLDPQRLREQLRDGDGRQDRSEDRKRDWIKDCRDDSSDHERNKDDDPDHRKKSDHKKKDSDDGDDDSSDGDDSGGSSKDDDSDDDATTTQVKVVPKGSVDTGDGSSL